MATTKKLKIPLLNGSDPFRRKAFNEAFEQVDEQALPIQHESSNAHFAMWKAKTVYKIKDAVRTPTCPSWGFYSCTIAGISGSSEPQGYGAGDIITDGSVTWELKELGGGSKVHKNLTGRSEVDQHPIQAITGLKDALDAAATKAELTKAIADLLNGAPAAYDTLKEIADALAADDTAIAGILSTLANKVDKETGKGLSSNDYDVVAKGKVDKLGEQNGKLTYNGNAIIGGATVWATNTDYNVGELVVYQGTVQRCLKTHTSSVDFATDKAKWRQLTLGYLPIWEAKHEYIANEIVTQGTTIIRCITPHISAATFDNVERNNWEVIAGRGAIIPSWMPNTDYGIDEACIYNDVLYLSNTAHTSSATFMGDMQVGTEKWRAINSGDSLGAILQVTKLGVVTTYSSPKVVDIPIEYTTTFAVPPVTILKFTPGQQDVVTTICAFDNTDASDFKKSEEVVFDGTMHLIIHYNINVSTPVAFGNGYFSESDEIDFNKYKSIINW